MKFDFGLVGLGVMGRNFILNVAENGFSSIGLSSSKEKIKLLKEEGKDFDIDGTQSDKVFIDSLSTPRKIMLLVPAGNPVDSMIDRFLPLLDHGDIIIDGGNYTSETLVTHKNSGLKKIVKKWTFIIFLKDSILKNVIYK